MFIMAVFCAFIWWMLFVKPANPIFTEVDPGAVKINSIDDDPIEIADINKRMGDVGVQVGGVDFSLSSRDGELILRLWAKEGGKVGNTFTLEEGVILFSLPEHDALLLKLSDSKFTSEIGTVEISGTITGEVLGTGQFFQAQELHWRLDEQQITANKVVYRGPNIDVSGEQMNLNLETGEISFEGLVEAGV